MSMPRWLWILASISDLTTALAQDPSEARAILQKSRDAFAVLKQYEFIATTRAETEDHELIENRTVRVLVERPNRIGIEGDDTMLKDPKDPARSIILVGSDQQTNAYLPDSGRFGKLTSDISEEASSLVSNPAN